MKTLVDIDEELIKKAMELSGTRTKKETIHIALEELIKERQRVRLKKLAGSGIVDMTTKELLTLRTKRQRKHKSIKKK